MNEAYTKDSLRDLLLANENTLVSGLTHQGQQRAIRQVALSNLTPPGGYYYILVYLTDAREFSRPQGSIMQNPTAVAEYDVQLELSDEAILQQADIHTEAYETMAMDFDKFSNRIVKLLREQSWIGDEPKLKLKRGSGEADRRIEKSNLSGNYTDTEEREVALLYCQIRFTLIEECVDTEGLYS